MLGTGVERYSRGGILLHWLIALALAAELAIGFGMPHDASGFELFQFHKSLGITILLLSILRLVWRLMHRAPPKLEKGFGGFLASAVHVLLYVFMVGAPLTGWAIVSTAELQVPTLLYGVVPWPHLPLPDAFNHSFEEVHEIFAFTGLGLFVLHVAGALRHHFLLHDTILRRMAPGGSPVAALGLTAAVLLLGGVLWVSLPGSGEHDHEHDHGDEAGVTGDEVSGADGTVHVHEDGEEHVHDEGADDDALTEDGAAAEEEATQEAEEQAVAAAAAPIAGPPPSWAIQPGGSLRFSVDNGGAAVSGSFSRWSGTIKMDPANPETAEIAIDIDLASASLGDPTQDEMIQGGEFFNTSANPTARFRSTEVTSTGTNAYRASGTLSLNGASRPQAITFTLSGSGARRSVSGSGTINRNAFGVGTGASAESIAANVSVTFAFDATKR